MPYAVVTKNADSKPVAVTFYYDTQKDSRTADNTTIVTKLNSTSAYREWADATLTSVTFDPSFAGFHDLTSLYQWFNNCGFLTSITGLENLNTENVTTMESMFNYCMALTELDLTNFDVSKVVNTYNMFNHCSLLETIYATTDWNTETNENSYYMFQGCDKLMGGAMSMYKPGQLDKTYAHPDGGVDNPGYFTDPAAPRPYAVVTKNADNKPVAVAFYYDTNMNSHQADDVTIIKTLNEANIASNWTGATLTSVTFDDSFASYKGLTGLAKWFYGCTALATINGLSNLSTENVTTMESMFWNCYNLTSLDLSNLSTGNVTTMASMFYRCQVLTELDVSGFNTGKVTNMASMFYGCKGLTELDVSGFNTGQVTTMNSMFSSCTNLQTITFGSQFTTANVTDLSMMFSGSSALTELDLSTFTIEKLTKAPSMFQTCSNLKTIYAAAGTDWSTSTTLTDSDFMFYGCTQLKGGRGTAYEYQYRDKGRARIDGLNGNPGYFTDPDAFLLGDVNDDGSITIADVTALVNIILGKDTAGQYNHAAADVNGDESITIADVTALVNIILGK